MPKRVWLDTDPAIGVRFRDVDDALAMLLLLSSPQIKLEGISVNFGNVNVHKGFEVGKEVLDVAGADVPIYKGAASRNELGCSNPAVAALMRAVADNPNEISLLAIGPLTNVATAMILDRNFAGNLRDLTVMGGSLKFRPFSFFGEFNFHCDARAAVLVMSAPINKTLLTMDLCAQAVFRNEHLDKIRRGDSRAAKYLAKHIPSWLMLNRLIFRKGGFFPWDPIAAAYLIDESLFDKNPCIFSIAEDGIRRGRIFSFEDLTDFEEKHGRIPINMPKKLDSARFMNLLLDGLLSI